MVLDLLPRVCEGVLGALFSEKVADKLLQKQTRRSNLPWNFCRGPLEITGKEKDSIWQKLPVGRVTEQV
jgi:hypothetical protein